MSDWGQWLEQISEPTQAQAPKDVLCLVLVHNEAAILPDLLDHYRKIGVAGFLVIDDHSTDDGPDFLASQTDVRLFRPRPGSTYAKDKRHWRGSLLDGFCDGQWAVVIDADEHMVWDRQPERPLAAVIADLEAEGAKGMAALMVDMYRDAPIAAHVARPANGPLRTQFPLFDDPAKDPLAYRLALTPSGFAANWPTPAMQAMGGMRDRMFDPRGARDWIRTQLLQRGAIGADWRAPAGVAGRAWARAVARLTRPRGAPPPLNLTKLPLVQWRRGMRFNGGAHHVSAHLPLGRERGVLLHFAITRGAQGISYVAARGQHADGGAHYRSMGDGHALDKINPVYWGSSELHDPRQLTPFFHPTR